jgi:hypothetical protein
MIQTMQSDPIPVFSYLVNFKDTTKSLCMTEQSDGIRAENISLLAFIIGIEARDVEDMNMTRLCVYI